MDKIPYVDFIEIYENEQTINLVGKIDTQFLKQNRIETLYYSLPLIERIVFEIYKLIPGSDIEHLEQGEWRTVLAIINNNLQLNVLPRYSIEIIEKYFKDDGIRNKIFHINDKNEPIEVTYREINFLIMKLINILKTNINKYIDVDFNYIEDIN